MGRSKRNYPLPITVPKEIIETIDEIRLQELESYIKRTGQQTLSTSKVATVIFRVGLRNNQAVIDEIRKLA